MADVEHEKCPCSTSGKGISLASFLLPARMFVLYYRRRRVVPAI
jgi:hypothetical protein